MQIGERIKTIREEKKLQQQEVCQRANMDLDHLDKIETGEIAPSLGSLIRLARVFGVRPGTFLDDENDKGIVITRSKDNLAAQKLSASGMGTRDNLSFLSLAREKSNRHMDPFLIEVAPGAPLHSSLSSHEGEEFIYVLKGSIEVVYGRDTKILHAGDSMYYDSVVGHQVKAPENESALILAVVYLPV
jgi:transcriptional regulator with XRE-family HTH domain